LIFQLILEGRHKILIANTPVRLNIQLASQNIIFTFFGSVFNFFHFGSFTSYSTSIADCLDKTDESLERKAERDFKLGKEIDEGRKTRISVVPKANAATQTATNIAIGINARANKPMSGANQRGT
jgi:hypothetical protein